jgi:hypothetical protein
MTRYKSRAIFCIDTALQRAVILRAMSVFFNQEGSDRDKAATPEYLKLIKLLGHDVVLIPCPWGTKVASIKWKQLGVESMSDSKHLRQLESGNIAVKLGHASGGLCSIDIDDDNQFEAFLELNPRLKDSLLTKGARGGNIWVYIDGEYPPSTNTGINSSWKIEWRAEGNYTMITGMHPSGCNYRFLNEVKPVLIPFNAINFPDCVSSIFVTTATQRTQRTQRTQIHNNNYINIPLVLHEALTFEQALDKYEGKIEATIPSCPGINHFSLFKVARIVLSIIVCCKRQLSYKELRTICSLWCKLNRSNLNPSLTEDDYFAELLESIEATRLNSEECEIALAADRTKQGLYPDELNQLGKQKELGLLAGLCYNLSHMSDDGAFYLSIASIKEHLFPDQNKTTGYRRLMLLKAYGVIQQTKVGSLKGRKASEFVWIGMPTNLENKAVSWSL